MGKEVYDIVIRTKLGDRPERTEPDIHTAIMQKLEIFEIAIGHLLGVIGNLLLRKVCDDASLESRGTNYSKSITFASGLTATNSS